MGQKHKRLREFWTPFPLRDIHENLRSNVRAGAAGDGAMSFKNRKIVPFHGANPNTKNCALTVSVLDYGSCLSFIHIDTECISENFTLFSVLSLIRLELVVAVAE